MGSPKETTSWMVHFGGLLDSANQDPNLRPFPRMAGHNPWLHFGVDQHPFATYFDAHQGYRILTHSHTNRVLTHSHMFTSEALDTRCLLPDAPKDTRVVEWLSEKPATQPEQIEGLMKISLEFLGSPEPSNCPLKQGVHPIEPSNCP